MEKKIYKLKEDIFYKGIFDIQIPHPNRLMEGSFFDCKKVKHNFYRDNILCGRIENGNLIVFKEINFLDGCSPKFKLFGKWFGTPDGANGRVQTEHAFVIHDFIYMFHRSIDNALPYGKLPRMFADKLFLTHLIINDFRFSKKGSTNKILCYLDYAPSYIYYTFVRAFGWGSWYFNNKKNAE